MQRGGRSAETQASSDSPIMVAQACFTQEGAALPSKALALPFSRRPVGRSPSLESHSRERILARWGSPLPKGCPSGACPLWAIGLVHGAVWVLFWGFGQLLTQVQGSSPLRGLSPDCILSIIVKWNNRRNSPPHIARPPAAQGDGRYGVASALFHKAILMASVEGDTRIRGSGLRHGAKFPR